MVISLSLSLIYVPSMNRPFLENSPIAVSLHLSVSLSEKSDFGVDDPRMSCNGCRVLRKGCSDGCVLRQCLHLIDSPQAQAHATLFVAKFFGRAALMSFVSAVPASHRPGTIPDFFAPAPRLAPRAPRLHALKKERKKGSFPPPEMLVCGPSFPGGFGLEFELPFSCSVIQSSEVYSIRVVYL